MVLTKKGPGTRAEFILMFIGVFLLVFIADVVLAAFNADIIIAENTIAFLLVYCGLGLINGVYVKILASWMANYEKDPFMDRHNY